MKTVKLIVKSWFHPYWQRGGYIIELPDGTELRAESDLVTVDAKGIWVQPCACSSGGGKVPMDGTHAGYMIKEKYLAISVTDYDTIEYVGKHKEMSETLKQDLIDNKLS